MKKKKAKYVEMPARIEITKGKKTIVLDFMEATKLNIILTDFIFSKRTERKITL